MSCRKVKFENLNHGQDLAFGCIWWFNSYCSCCCVDVVVAVAVVDLVVVGVVDIALAHSMILGTRVINYEFIF